MPPVVFGIIACACIGIMGMPYEKMVSPLARVLILWGHRLIIGITASACIGIMESFVRYREIGERIAYIRRMGYMGILRHYDIKTPHASWGIGLVVMGDERGGK